MDGTTKNLGIKLSILFSQIKLRSPRIYLYRTKRPWN